LATKLKKASIAIREKSKRDLSPKWEGAEDWTGDQFNSHFRRAMEFYRMESSGKDLKPQIINWMSKNGYTKEQIAELKNTKDSRCGVTMGGIAACLNRGMPPVHAGFNNGKDTALWLGTEIANVIEQGKYDVAEADEGAVVKSSGPTITIQDRVREASLSMTEEIEQAIDIWHSDPEAFDPKSFKLLNLLKGKGAKAAHARIIKDFYSKWLNELTELSSGSADEQLREGYRHRSRKHIKKIMDFLSEVQSACTMLMQEAKVNKKPRKTKTVSKDKLVAKLNFLKTDQALKLVSVNPVDIIGSKELWIYNTKTRKLGRYVAAEFGDLGVKGTSITGFDETKSICKTLRKPEEQLKAFKAAGKVALRKFLDDINSVDSQMNGRLNEHTILLKVN
jgi:hypothetical protein